MRRKGAIEMKRQQNCAVIGLEDCVANQGSAIAAIRFAYRVNRAAENLGESSQALRAFNHCVALASGVALRPRDPDRSRRSLRRLRCPLQPGQGFHNPQQRADTGALLIKRIGSHA